MTYFDDLALGLLPDSEHATDSPRWSGGLKTPLGGAPPPHVFGVRALYGLLEVWQHSALKSGVLLESWVMPLFLALFLARSRLFLARSRLFSSWAVLLASCGVLWSIWGRFGPSWAVLGPSWGRLGRQVGAKWPSWARLGAVLGGLGRDFGAKMGPKIDQKTDQKFEVISRSIFGATPKFLEPTCSDFGSFGAHWILKSHDFP